MKARRWWSVQSGRTNRTKIAQLYSVCLFPIDSKIRLLVFAKAETEAVTIKNTIASGMAIFGRQSLIELALGIFSFFPNLGVISKY